MKQSDGHRFRGAGDVNLFYRSWIPEKDYHTVVIIVHGGGDHSGRYLRVVNALVPAGYAVYAADLRGHGHSPGRRGHVNSWQEYRDDLSAFIQLVYSENPGCQLVLFGHSMGGVIVLDYCLQFPGMIDSVICTSPAIGKLGIAPVLFLIAKMLDKIWPSVVLPTGLDVTKLSREPGFAEQTLADPMYHRKATPRFGMEMQKTVRYIHTHAGEFKLPLYLAHGTGDEIASIEGSRRLSGSIDPELITYREYENAYHELFNDIIGEKVMDDILRWLKDRFNP